MIHCHVVFGRLLVLSDTEIHSKPVSVFLGLKWILGVVRIESGMSVLTKVTLYDFWLRHDAVN